MKARPVSVASKKIKHSKPPWQQQRQSIIVKSQNKFRCNCNANLHDANSDVNPYVRYHSQFSPHSINNPYGAGSRNNQGSPNNPYGSGLAIIRR